MRLEWLFTVPVLVLLLGCYKATNSNVANVASILPIPTPTLVQEPAVERETNVARLVDEQATVVPGLGTEKVRLGMSGRELKEVLGEPSEEDAYKEGNCDFTTMRWMLHRKPGSTDWGDGIYAFLKEDKAYEISFSGQNFRTENSFSLGSFLSKVKLKSTAPLYLLSPSASTATNDADLVYLVEKPKGIAFEFAVGYKSKSRVLSSIYVFPPDQDFVPQGCLSFNQTFSEVKVGSL